MSPVWIEWRKNNACCGIVHRKTCFHFPLRILFAANAHIRNTSLWDQNNKLFHGFLCSNILRSPRSLPQCRTGRPRHLSPVSWSAWFMVFLIVNFTLSSYKWMKRANEMKSGTLSDTEKMACSCVRARFVHQQKNLCISFSFVLANFIIAFTVSKLVIYSPLIRISMNLVCLWCNYGDSPRSFCAEKRCKHYNASESRKRPCTECIM